MWSGRRWHWLLKGPQQLRGVLPAGSSLVNLLHVHQAKHAPVLRVMMFAALCRFVSLLLYCHAGTWANTVTRTCGCV